MKCTAYYEENEIIPYDKYKLAVEKLPFSESEGANKGVVVRKAFFGGGDNRLEMNDRVTYAISMKDFQDKEIYLEKKTMENGMVFKSFTKISRKEADRMFRGQFQWMKHGKGIVQDFYLESQINGLKLKCIRESKKDVYGQIRGLDGIVFKRRIRSTAISEYDGEFFQKELPMVDLLNCDNVLYSYRRYVHIPQAVSNIMHLQSGHKSELAYSI